MFNLFELPLPIYTAHKNARKKIINCATDAVRFKSSNFDLFDVQTDSNLSTFWQPAALKDTLSKHSRIIS